jgi:hypothetical protein
MVRIQPANRTPTFNISGAIANTFNNSNAFIGITKLNEVTDFEPIGRHRNSSTFPYILSHMRGKVK